MPLPEDTILENRYRIDRLLAHGGMGAVYKGFDTNLLVPVAIKENFLQTPQSIRQFEQEALILARLHHPALPRVTHHFHFEGQQYLVMDFVEGEDLWEMVKKQGHPLDEVKALEFIIQVCQAVSYLHRQNPPIIHRDIKPQNIKVTPEGQAVLVDFGIAKQTEADSRTSTGARGVTPGFSPPEQYGGVGTTPASDIYSLGATLYAILTGKRPPDSVSLLVNRAKFEPPNEINPKLSPQVCQAIMHAMQPQPAGRPQSVIAWQGELESILEISTLAQEETPTILSSPSLTRPDAKAVPAIPAISPPKPQRAFPFKRRWMLAAAGIVVIILAVIGAIILITARSEKQTKATAQASATAAAEAQAVATATAEGRATATAQAVATATTEGKATATAESRVTTTATARAIVDTTLATAIAQDIVFQDDFSSNTKGWPIGEYSDEYSNGIVQIINGKYRKTSTSKQPAMNITWIPYFSAKNFLLSVEATIVETSYDAGDHRITISFRMNNNNDSYYVVEFANKYYSAGLWKDNQWITLRDWTFSRVVKVEPGVPNIFEILVEDSSFTLYANGQKLTTVTDSTLSSAGKIALGLDLTEAGQTVTVDFDNLVIREVPSLATATPKPSTNTPKPTSTPTISRQVPAPTNTPTLIHTPSPSPMSTATIDADLTISDDFNNPAFDGTYNSELWSTIDQNSMLHGAPLDHRALFGCMEPIFKNRDGWRRIYPDLPGMGRTKGVHWLTSADQMLQVVLEFIDRVIPGQSFTLVGHSYAGYLARGIIYHRRQAVDGLFLLVPWIKYDREERSVPEKVTLIEDPALLAQLDPDEAEGFAFGAVVQNQKNWERYRREWLPGILAHDPRFFAQLFEHPAFSFEVDGLSEPFVKPTLILVGKQDHWSGYLDQWDILENYPRATFVVLDRTGHRLQIEQEELFNALVNEWLDRVEESMVFISCS